MPEIIAINILNAIFVLFASIAFFMSLNIIVKWDKSATSSLQYKLEKQSYLAATIIKYILYIKVPLFLFFVFVLDKLSFIIPGAMCGAGVINASENGTGLILLKILNIYLFTYWLVLDKEDMKYEAQPYLKDKFYLFIVLFILFMIEIALESNFFYSLDIQTIVDCCGVIFSNSDGTYISKILGLSPSILLPVFYGNYLLLLLFWYLKKKTIFSFLNLLFIIISLISLIAFFGIYIYELPTHHCPFCMLQKDYNYIGYLLYLFLFLGTFNGLVVGVLKLGRDDVMQRYRVSILFNSLYLIFVTYYVLSFYFRNGVWL